MIDYNIIISQFNPQEDIVEVEVGTSTITFSYSKLLSLFSSTEELCSIGADIEIDNFLKSLPAATVSIFKMLREKFAQEGLSNSQLHN